MLPQLRMHIHTQRKHTTFAQQEAVEAFGELEELKDRLAASEAARAAAERRADEGASQCSSMEDEIQRCRSAMQAAQARHLPLACSLAGILTEYETLIIVLINISSLVSAGRSVSMNNLHLLGGLVPDLDWQFVSC